MAVSTNHNLGGRVIQLRSHLSDTVRKIIGGFRVIVPFKIYRIHSMSNPQILIKSAKSTKSALKSIDFHSSLSAFNRETSNSKFNERPLPQKDNPLYLTVSLTSIDVCGIPIVMYTM